MSELSVAITNMGRALHALRLEVPKAVADDVTARWHALLDALDEDTLNAEVDNLHRRTVLIAAVAELDALEGADHG